MKTCSKCGEQKPYSYFSINKTKKDGYNGHCRECKRKYTQEHYKRNKEKYIKSKAKSNKIARKYIYKLLSESCCNYCGEDNPLTLEFNHINPKEKYMNIGSMVSGRGIETIKKEIEKCEIVCSNCHSRITATQNSWYSDMEGVEKFYITPSNGKDRHEEAESTEETAEISEHGEICQS